MSFDEANPFPKDCPKTDVGHMDSWEDAALYDDASEALSPILEEVQSTIKLPNVSFR